MTQATPTATQISPWDRRLSMTQDALLVVVSAMFFFAHASSAVGGRLTSAGFAVEQGLLVGMFLTRRRSIATSRRPQDWIVAGGGWLTLLMRPADGSPPLAEGTGGAIQLLGLTGTCICFLYLGRSFGVVAANRGLKVHGPYRFVRHPIYLTHTITATGFVLANFTAINLGILVTVTVVQVLRLKAEERILSETAAYAAYATRVRWRLVPGLY